MGTSERLLSASSLLASVSTSFSDLSEFALFSRVSLNLTDFLLFSVILGLYKGASSVTLGSSSMFSSTITFRVADKGSS